MDKTIEAVIKECERKLNEATVCFLFFFLFFFIYFFFFHTFLIFFIRCLFSCYVSSRQNTISFYATDKQFLQSWWVTSSMGRCCWWNIAKRHRAGRTSRSKRQIDPWLWQMHPPRIRHHPLSLLRSAIPNQLQQWHPPISTRPSPPPPSHPFLAGI